MVNAVNNLWLMRDETTELFQKVLVWHPPAQMLTESTTNTQWNTKNILNKVNSIGENVVNFVKQDGTFHSAQMA